MKKNLVSVLCLTMIAGTMGCQSPKHPQGEEAVACDTITQKKVENEFVSLLGTYCGTFPCADCAGKQVELTLMEDQVYSLAYEYLDADSHSGIIEECGTYNIINGSIIETITPSSNEKTYYVYVHGNLILSDSLGTVNRGELADSYILMKDTLEMD